MPIGGIHQSILLALIATFILMSTSTLAEATSYAPLASKRPRLFATEAAIVAARAANPGTELHRIREKIVHLANCYAKNIPRTREARRKIRSNSKRLPFLSLAYLITRKPAFFEAAMQYVEVMTTVAEGLKLSEDLDRAHLIIGLATMYDWLYDDMDNEQRTIVKTLLTAEADLMYDCFIAKRQWWTKNYLQNHNYIDAMSLTAAGVALIGLDSRAKRYLDISRQNFDHVLAILSPDGASHEGVNYWSYGTCSILMHFYALKRIGELEVAKGSSYLKNATRFRRHVSLPGFDKIANYADSCDVEFYNSGTVLRGLAKLFSDGNAQWLLRTIEKARGEDVNVHWLDLLWEDTGVAPVPPNGEETTAWFPNMGFFISRTSWKNDAVWCFFKAGPPQGKLAADRGLYVGSHVHPDTGNFLLYRGGWQIVDDSYVFHKLTSNHNVLLVNGKGQLGEGERWLNKFALKKAKARVLNIQPILQSEANFIKVDLQDMYPDAARLSNWRRTFVALSDGTVVIHDSVKASPGKKISFRIHFANTLTRDGKFWVSGRGSDSIIASFFSPFNMSLKQEQYSPDDRNLSDVCKDNGGNVITLTSDSSTTIWSVFVPKIPNAIMAPPQVQDNPNLLILTMGDGSKRVLDIKNHLYGTTTIE